MRHLLLFVFVILAPCGVAFAQEPRTQPGEIFGTSLHHTSQGIAYWYGEKQGGLGSLTGLPITEFGCTRCHIDSCETCHLKEEGGARTLSGAQARSPKTCGKCHGFADVAATRARGGVVDVHFEKGMSCMDCHTTGDVHGNGKAYNSMREEGAIEARCDKCHEKLTATPSHTVHGAALSCETCHVREMPSCHNCHVETRLRDKKSVAMPLSNVIFLVNQGGKVRPGICLTFTYKNKTLVEFAASFKHTVLKQGRTCKECHATSIVADIRAGSFSPGKYENGEYRSVSGVVPVVDGMKWPFVFFNREDGKWIPNPDAAPPVIHYSGYSSPLTPEQFKKLQASH
jgi:hypothetical protein